MFGKITHFFQITSEVALQSARPEEGRPCRLARDRLCGFR